VWVDHLSYPSCQPPALFELTAVVVVVKSIICTVGVVVIVIIVEAPLPGSSLTLGAGVMVGAGSDDTDDTQQCSQFGSVMQSISLHTHIHTEVSSG
jgi:hypothetical protein